MKRWTKDEVNYLVNFYATKDFKTLSTEMQRTEGAIRAKCFELNLIKHDKWTDDELTFLKDHRYDMTTREIAESLNRSECAVHLKTNRLGIKKSPYYCDYDFFKNIDSEEKAYWLGFIYADGWISVNGDTNSGAVGMTLQRGDANHLKKFNKSIGGNYKIVYGEKACGIANRTVPHKNCSIRIYSINMVNDLQSHGVNDHKTCEIEMPTIDKDLMRHFLRGFFDGDGCVRIRTQKNGRRYPACDITCHVKSFLDTIRANLYSLGITSFIYPEKTNHRLYISGNDSNVAFLKYLYDDATIYLDRKFEKYKQIMELTTERNCLAG